MFKKDFQKVIAAIRKELGKEKYPKAMCTSAQMMKNQATVNCGGEWRPDSSPETAKQVMEHQKFKDLLAKYSAKAAYETGSYGDRTWTQIRIQY